MPHVSAATPAKIFMAEKLFVDPLFYILCSFGTWI
jgi:hypothetical protein